MTMATNVSMGTINDILIRQENNIVLVLAVSLEGFHTMYANHGTPFKSEEIKDHWSQYGKEAANRGTWMHYLVELWLNRCPVSLASPEMQLFEAFVRELQELRAYRTEWQIFGEQEFLAGSIDFVASDVDGNLVLFDWKRTKDLGSKYENRFGEIMFSPLQHISDCCGQHYRLQLNCYRYLLQKYYGVIVSQMYVVGLNPDNGAKAYVDNVPVMESETEALMAWQRQQVHSM